MANNFPTKRDTKEIVRQAGRNLFKNKPCLFTAKDRWKYEPELYTNPWVDKERLLEKYYPDKFASETVKLTSETEDGKTNVMREIGVSYVPPPVVAQWKLVLPTTTGGTAPDVEWGVEEATFNNFPWMARFRLDADLTVKAVWENKWDSQIEKSVSLPSDYDTALHTYRIITFPGKVDFWIDDTLKATIDGIPIPIDTHTCMYLYNKSNVAGLPVYISWMRLTHYEQRWRRDYFGAGGTDWNGTSISAGDQTDPVSMIGYAGKTIYFLSDTAGTLTVQVIDPDGTRRTYGTTSVDANSLEEYTISGVTRRVALKFDTAATVTAWYELQAP